MFFYLWAVHGLISFSIVSATDSQLHSSSPSNGYSFAALSVNKSSTYSNAFPSSGPPRKVSSLSTDSTCFGIRTFSSASSLRCCGPCSIVYPDVQILHWPVTRTNTWCDSIKADLSRSPFSTIAPQASPPPSGAVVDYASNISTAGFAKSLLTQGPAFIYESIDNYGNIVKGTTSSIGADSHVTQPPTSGSYSIDENGFVYVSPSVYAIIPYVIATDDCAPVPPTLTSVILAYPEGKMLTRANPDFPAAFLNPADLGCPPEYNYLLTQPGQNGVVQTSTGTDGRITIPDEITLSNGLNELKTYVAEYTPSLLVDLQSTLLQILPQWKHCSDGELNTAYPFGRDPPRVIQPMNGLAGPTTADDGQPAPTSGVDMPQAKSVPPSPIPTATPSPNNPGSQANVTPKLNDPPQGDPNPQGNGVPGSSAAPLKPASMSAPGQETPDDPSGPSDANGKTQDIPLNTADPTKAPQGPPPAASNPSKTAQSNQAAPPESNDGTQDDPLVSPDSNEGGQDPSGVPSNPSKGTQIPSPNQPDNNQPVSGPGTANAHPVQSQESLPNAPAFAQFDPNPLQTGGAAGAATGNDVNTQPSPASLPISTAASGIGAFVNAAINGLMSSPVPSPSSAFDDASLLSALQVSPASTSGSTAISYSRSFNFQVAQGTASANAPSTSASPGSPQNSDSGSQLLSSLPALVVDSSAASSSTTIQGLSSAPTSQSGNTAIGMQTGNLQTGTSGTAKASPTLSGSATKQAGYELWKIWVIVTFAGILNN